jgi:hypothetical protein
MPAASDSLKIQASTAKKKGRPRRTAFCRVERARDQRE